MQEPIPSVAARTLSVRGQQRQTIRLAVNEYELANRWGLSVKTLRRWRQEQLGPIFLKLNSRVTYLISEVEAFERRVSRYSTSSKVHP